MTFSSMATATSDGVPSDLPDLARAPRAFLEHVNHRVPVTALSFFDDSLLFVGYGNYLVALERSTHVTRVQIKVFDNQAIHGIIAGKNRLVVWGGPWLASLHVVWVENNVALSNLNCHKTTDWILSAALNASEQFLAVVNAHNALSVVRFEDFCTTRPLKTLRQIVPASNSILYAAHMSWLDENTCLVASGTAFGDIIIWSSNILDSGTDLTAKSQTHYTFAAHDGSVFGVQISPSLDLESLGTNKRVLASCSDDRTIRLWDISNLDVVSPDLAELQRDTGFGSNPQAESNAPPCLAKQMGHISRIWKVRFLMPHQETPLRIVSFGEDACNITWSLRPNSTPEPESYPHLYHLDKVRSEQAHNGKHIWSVDVGPDGSLITGGADGAISIHKFHINATHLPRRLSEGTTDKASGKDTIKAYNFLHDRLLIATSEEGEVLRIDIELNHITFSQVSSPLRSLRGYSLIASDDTCAFIAGIDGCIYGYSIYAQRVFELAHAEGKVAGLFVDRGQGCQSHVRHLLVTVVGRAAAILHRIEGGTSSDPLKVQSSTQLNLPEQTIVTSFAIIEWQNVSQIVVGTRSGSLVMFPFQIAAQKPSIDHGGVVPLVHGKDAITSLCQFGRELHSIGRDGTHACHQWARAEDSVSLLETVHRSALPFGPKIEGMCMTDSHHLWLWGFRSTQFVVYDATTQHELMTVECGGANRNWAYEPNNSGGVFVWTKASKVFWYAQTSVINEMVNSGGHGREIKTVAISNGAHQLIATGAEDTDIKLHSYDENGAKFRCLHTLRKHNTGIQHMQFSEDEHADLPDALYLFSSGGFEEFYVWRISGNVQGLGVGVVCESAHPSSGKSDLRITGFEASRIADGYHIAMAYSDSTIKEWLYLHDSWKLLSTGNYLTSCLTQIARTRPSSKQLMTASTDGHLAFWSDPGHGDVGSDDVKFHNGLNVMVRVWQRRWRVHQNSILALARLQLVDGSTLVATGGDDNAIGITRVPMSQEPSQSQVKTTVLLPKAHAAAVTGLGFIRLPSPSSPESVTIMGKSLSSRVLLLSASIDQKLKVWELNIDEAGGPIDDGRTIEERIQVKRLLANVPTAVADVSSLEFCRLPNGSIGILICGVGMDLWRLDMNLAEQI